MRTPVILFTLCVACVAASIHFNGAKYTLLLAIAGPAMIASLILVVRALPRRAREPKRRRQRQADISDVHVNAPEPATAQDTGPNVVIDGSNVMHWNGDLPRLATLRDVIAEVRAKGFQPGIIFDANAGYKLADRYLDDGHFATLLNLPGDRVLVVAKGEPADPTILAAARELDAKVLTNDRYRDWAGQYPEVTDAGHLVRGGYEDGKLWLAEGSLAA